MSKQECVVDVTLQRDRVVKYTVCCEESDATNNSAVKLGGFEGFSKAVSFDAE